ncbi:MAG: DNA polymerase IV [Candidatus ainarchaeum sp.]|nr:DNA polymerase IV [Candidatus ainarchaeum sp.]
MDKIIGLIDIDYFYAQCEIIKNPELKNKPVVIFVETIREGSGVVATSNYLARKLKISSGMPFSLAKRLADKNTVFIKSDKDYYEEISKKVFEIIDYFLENVEQVSIDEAYIDLTNNEGFDKSVEIVKKIKERIKSETGLTCSVGISFNKFLAKMASNEKKPDGLYVIKKPDYLNYLKNKPIDLLPGVGEKIKDNLNKIGVKQILDLNNKSLDELIVILGQAKAKTFFSFVNGVDDRLVISNREKQQISKLMTLKKDSLILEEILPTLYLMCDLISVEVNKSKKSFRTCSLIIINSKFETITKSKTINDFISVSKLKEIEYLLLKEYLDEYKFAIRRIGVKVSNFNIDFGAQKKLFEF